jgi:hypothetical protein
LRELQVLCDLCEQNNFLGWYLFGKESLSLVTSFTPPSSFCHFLMQKVTKNLFAEVLFQID